MLKIEVLENLTKSARTAKKARVMTSFLPQDSLTLIGQSTGAHLHLAGEGIGALHVGIKYNKSKKDDPVIMDLGGPTPIKVNGKETLEHVLTENEAEIEIGSRRIRIVKVKDTLPDIKRQKWEPVTDGKSKALTLRVRVYVKGVPAEVTNTNNEFILDTRYGVFEPFKLAWLDGKKAKAVVPKEWVGLKGRVQAGDKIEQLTDWSSPQNIEPNQIYRIQAGPYQVELLLSSGQLIIGRSKSEILSKDLRKPLAISASSVLIIFALWMWLLGKPKEEVEEPYAVYARIQNVPIEKIPDPDPADGPNAGGGSGGAKEATAPQAGETSQSAPSKLALALTGGLKNLVGNVLSQSKSSNAVVSESGVGQVAAQAGAGNTEAGKLASVGQGTASVAGASKLGNLALAGSGQGFSGGSGTGLGTGSGAGIGTGMGNGIGRGSYKLVEEESIVDGGLDKSVIAAIIQNNLGQIKYCYERQLVAEPDLFGKVVALWIINAEGRVENANVKQTTLNSPPVEQCMMSKISGWKFPQPKNGTKVTVTYPFLFKSTK